MRVGSCEVWLVCDDQRLPEYAVECKENTITCFVPSEAGKKFEIHGRNDYNEILSLGVYLDGSWSNTMSVDPGKTTSTWGARTSATIRQPYQFSEIATTDDEDALHQQDAASIGTIKVKGWRMRWITTGRITPYQSTTFKAASRVHEKSKKAGTHHIALGDPVTVKPPSSTSSRAEYLDKSPILKFVYNYRPLALLQAQEIAPLSQSNGLQSGPAIGSPQSQLASSSSQLQSRPGPSGHPAEQRSEQPQAESSRPAKRARLGSEETDTKPDVDVESDDDDELGTLKSSASVLQGQLQQLMSKIERIESKRGRKAGGSRRVAKKEEPADAGFVSGDVIDLTLSD